MKSRTLRLSTPGQTAIDQGVLSYVAHKAIMTCTDITCLVSGIHADTDMQTDRQTDRQT